MEEAGGDPAARGPVALQTATGDGVRVGPATPAEGAVGPRMFFSYAHQHGGPARSLDPAIPRGPSRKKGGVPGVVLFRTVDRPLAKGMNTK